MISNNKILWGDVMLSPGVWPIIVVRVGEFVAALPRHDPLPRERGSNSAAKVSQLSNIPGEKNQENAKTRPISMTGKNMSQTCDGTVD